MRHVDKRDPSIFSEVLPAQPASQFLKGSNAESGSSSSKTRGSVINARASATRCCCHQIAGLEIDLLVSQVELHAAFPWRVHVL